MPLQNPVKIRQVTKGTSANFDTFFLDEDKNPLVPLNDNYPTVSIEDPEGNILTQGQGANVGQGRYRFSWFVPVDSPSTSGDHYYQITWYFTTIDNQQLTRQAQFAIISDADLSPTERSYTYLCAYKESERLLIRFRQEPEELAVTLIAPNGEQFVASKPDMTMVQDGGSFVYYVDSPPLEGYGNYTVMWRSRQTLISQRNISVQQVRVPEPLFYTLAPSLRMMIDKSQKKTGLVQAYSDSDIYEYLTRGAGFINQTNPITYWSLANFPGAFGFTEYLLMASALWALNAQYLAEIELNTGSFSGQTITFDVDRGGAYESAITRLQEQLKDGLQNTKRGWLRTMSTGVIAGRPYDYGLQSLVTRVWSQQGNQILPLLARLGIA
jgi:hypothetical protein